MSKVAIQGNASGTGTFTIQSPATNTDRALTLPDEAGTVLTSASDIESQVKTATNATGTAPIYACRAWVNFNGTGTVAIRDSGNVSSITDNGTGYYTLNFTTAMPDDFYATNANNCSTSGQFSFSGITVVPGAAPTSPYAGQYNTTGVSILMAVSGSATDVNQISVSVFR